MSSSTFTLSTSQLLAQHSSTPQNLRESEGPGGTGNLACQPANQIAADWIITFFSFFFTLPSSSHITTRSHGLWEPMRQGEITAADPSLWMDQCWCGLWRDSLTEGTYLSGPADGPLCRHVAEPELGEKRVSPVGM